jgi:hypothetical protein
VSEQPSSVPTHPPSSGSSSPKWESNNQNKARKILEAVGASVVARDLGREGDRVDDHSRALHALLHGGDDAVARSLSGQGDGMHVYVDSPQIIDRKDSSGREASTLKGTILKGLVGAALGAAGMGALYPLISPAVDKTIEKTETLRDVADVVPGFGQPD